MRIGLAAIGDPFDPGLWSGTPANIAAGLRGLGVEVVPLDVSVPRSKRVVDAVAVPYVLRRMWRDSWHMSLGRGRLIARESMLLSRLHGWRGSQALRRIGGVDGIVQIGTGFKVQHDKVVSYEDMTIPQAIRSGEYFWEDVPAHRAKARLRQQAQAYQRLDGAAFATRWAAQSAIEDLGCPRHHAHFVGIGPNFDTTGTDARDWTRPRFLFVGREWERKNGAAVVAAFSEIHRQYPNAELHLVGDHPRIDAPGVTGHGYLSLRDPASRERMQRLWASATCCVVPSRFEPAGIIYVEALHAGIPSIGSTRGGAADIIGDAGCTVDPGDPEALTRAMIHFCEPATASAAGHRARARREQFTWNAVADGLLKSLGLAAETS